MDKRRDKTPPVKPRANTSDVLGVASMGTPEPIQARWRKHFDLLTDLRERMLRRQERVSQDATEETGNFGTHIADAGTDSYDRDFALSMLSSEQDAVYQIEQAIDRIRHGTYGTCELTGKPIEPERLLAIPWARFGADAERQLESEGRRKRTRLRPRDTVAKAEGAEGAETAEGEAHEPELRS